MPRVDDGDIGKPVDVIWNLATCVNRLNNGQLNEVSLLENTLSLKYNLPDNTSSQVVYNLLSL